jgi:hypothetical protein
MDYRRYQVVWRQIRGHGSGVEVDGETSLCRSWYYSSPPSASDSIPTPIAGRRMSSVRYVEVNSRLPLFIDQSVSL